MIQYHNKRTKGMLNMNIIKNHLKKVRKNGLMLEFIDDQTEEICLEAC